jgi:ankyrin repeat protein
VKELIERKADVNARNDFGQTALGFAIQCKRSPEMINYLISKGGIE